MSLLNKASLIQIPSGYKDGTLYSAKPSNGDGDFTFSRGSNLAATRVNSEGLIEKGRENLALYSQEQTNGVYGQNNIDSVVAVSNPLTGENDAFKITSNTSGDPYFFQNITSVGNGVYTLSYWLWTDTGQSTEATMFFYNQSGTEINTKSITLTTTPTRYSFNVNFANTGATVIARLDFRQVGGSTQYIYTYGWQVERGLVATDYIPTTTTTEQAGILEDMPRLDYSGGATCPSLLLEPQRTNAFPQSEYPSTSTLNLVNGGYTWTHNQTNSPEGIQNASKWAAANNNAVVGVYQNFSATSGASYTFSVFAKKGDHNFIQLQNGGGGSGANSYANFDLENGTKSDGATITDSFINDFGNGWYRIGITFTTSLTSTSNCSIDIIDSLSAGRNSTFTGSVGDYFYIWGMQVEQGSYVSSYIPTYGASVTRGADIATNDNANLIGLDEFTFLWDGVLDSPRNGSGTFAHLILDGTIGFKGASNTEIRVDVVGSGNFAKGTSVQTLTEGRHKFLLKMSSSGTGKLYIDGSEISGGITYSGTTFTTDDGKLDGGSYKQNVNKVLIFPTALSDDECIQLTTI